MTPQEIERFRRAEAIFHAALKYPAGQEREAFLEASADRTRSWRMK